MGLLVFVLRHANFPDCSNGGLSSRHDSICVVNMEGPFQPKEDTPAFLLVNHYQDCCCLKPAIPDGKGGWIVEPSWYMHGGNYANTSDSRFGQAIQKMTGKSFYGALAIHDRREV